MRSSRGSNSSLSSTSQPGLEELREANRRRRRRMRLVKRVHEGGWRLTFEAFDQLAVDCSEGAVDRALERFAGADPAVLRGARRRRVAALAAPRGAAMTPRPSGDEAARGNTYHSPSGPQRVVASNVRRVSRGLAGHAARRGPQMRSQSPQGGRGQVWRGGISKAIHAAGDRGLPQPVFGRNRACPKPESACITG
jgi:hypothetical protein